MCTSREGPSKTALSCGCIQTKCRTKQGKRVYLVLVVDPLTVNNANQPTVISSCCQREGSDEGKVLLFNSAQIDVRIGKG